MATQPDPHAPSHPGLPWRSTETCQDRCFEQARFLLITAAFRGRGATALRGYRETSGVRWGRLCHQQRQGNTVKPPFPGSAQQKQWNPLGIHFTRKEDEAPRLGATAPRALLLEVAGAQRRSQRRRGTRTPGGGGVGTARKTHLFSAVAQPLSVCKAPLFTPREPALRRGRTGSQRPLSAAWPSSFVPTGQAHSRGPTHGDPHECPRDGPLRRLQREVPKGTSISAALTNPSWKKLKSHRVQPTRTSEMKGLKLL